MFPFKAVLFDWAYTLVDLGVEDDHAAFKKLFDFLREKRAIVWTDDDGHIKRCQEMFRGMIRLSRETLREACFEQVLNYWLLGNGVVLPEEITERQLLEIYYREIYAGRKVYDDAAPALRALAEKGVRMGIVSNTTNPAFMKDYERKICGLDPFFEFAIYSSAVPYRKPHPSIFHLAAQRLRLDPADILFVGDDLQADVAGAQAAGFASAWLNRSWEARGGAAPDYEINSLRELLRLPVRRVGVP